MYIYLLVTVKNIPKAIPVTQKTRQKSSISCVFMYEISIFETEMLTKPISLISKHFPHMQKPNLGFIHSLLWLNLSLPTDRKIR